MLSLPTRYISSIEGDYIVLGTKSRLLDPTFSSSSELILIKKNKFIRQKTPTRFNDILLSNGHIICAKENELAVYEIDHEAFEAHSKNINQINEHDTVESDSDSHDLKNVEDQANETKLNAALIFKNAYKITVTSVRKTPKPTMYLLATNKLVFLDISTLKLYNVGSNIENIQNISYNKKVSHIISIISSDNKLIIYDLKKKESVITKQYNNLTMAEWLPFHTTQMIILADKTLTSLDLSSDKMQTVDEPFNGFQIFQTQSNENGSVDDSWMIYAWNDQSLVKYSLDYQMLETTNIPDLFHFNQSKVGNGLVSVFTQTSGGTSIVTEPVRRSLLVNKNNILLDGKKFRIKGKLFQQTEENEKSVEQQTYSLDGQDETVQNILNGEFSDEKCCENIPLVYLLKNDKIILLENKNFKSLLLVCHKENDWAFLLKNKIINYKEIVKIVQKQEGETCGQALKDLITTILENMSLSDHEIIELFDLVGEENRSWCVKFKQKITDGNRNLATLTKSYNQMLGVLQDAEKENVDLQALCSEIYSESSDLNKDLLLKFSAWADFQGYTQLTQSFAKMQQNKQVVKQNINQKAIHSSSTIRDTPERITSTRVPGRPNIGQKPSATISRPPTQISNRPTSASPVQSQTNATPRQVPPIPNSQSMRQNATAQRTVRPPDASPYPTRPSINSPPPIVPRPSQTPDISRMSVTPNQQPSPQNVTARPKRPSYADIMSNAKSSSRPGPPHPKNISGHPSQLNMQQPDASSHVLPPRPGRNIPLPPTQFNRTSQAIDQNSAPQRMSPKPSVFENQQPSHSSAKNILQNTGYPVQRSPAHPQPSNLNVDRFSDEEKKRINDLVLEVIAYVKSESMKKKSIVYRSRIKDGLTKLQNHSEIINENDLNLLKNLGEDVKENLCIIERVHGALSECRSWVDGIIALNKVIKA